MQRICFLGRGGSGKSTLAQNLSQALTAKGYRVLLVGNDSNLSSTVLLRGDRDVQPALEEYREHYEIDLNDYVISTPSGVFCLELGSIEPGAGCLARGIHLMDDLLITQGVCNRLQIDFIFYDISGETPCTGYILPIRDGLMQQCIVVTNGSFAALTTANSLLQAIQPTVKEKGLQVQLLLNCVEQAACAELSEYARRVQAPVLARIHYQQDLEYSALMGKTVFDFTPESPLCSVFYSMADGLLCPPAPQQLTPFSRAELIPWLRGWQRRILQQRLLQEQKGSQAQSEACHD